MQSVKVREPRDRSHAQQTTLKAGSSSRSHQGTLLTALLLIIATMAIYSSVAHNGFVNFDDDQYILGTPQIHQGYNGSVLRWSFTTFAQANWHPITWLSHAVDDRLFQSQPAAVHLESVLIHALTAAILFLLLLEATGSRWKSLAVSALYALHPLNVEAVAWASERKTVLSMFFFMLALWGYGRYAKQRSVGRYIAVAAAFAVGLMAKPQIVTFPFVLLLWDVWPLARVDRTETFKWPSIRPLVVEKIPLLVLSAASAVITMRAQAAGGAVNDSVAVRLSLRLANAVVSYARYLGKAIWPSKLAVIYPYPVDGLPAWQIVGATALLIAISALVSSARKRTYLAVGWLWFLGTFVPMVGLVQVGEAAMADRYAGLPFIGLFLMVVWGVSDLASERAIPAAWVGAAAGLMLVALSVTTYRQVGKWHDSESLWTHALAVTKNNFVAHDNLAVLLISEQKDQDALQHFQAAVALQPRDPLANLYLGMYEGRRGNHVGARDHLKTALDAIGDNNPDWKGMAYANLGTAYRSLHSYPEAQQSFQAALRIDPGNLTAQLGMGLIAEHDKNYAEAVHWYSEAMREKPGAVPSLLLSNALRENGQNQEAVDAFRKAQDMAKDFQASMRIVDQMLISIE